MSRSVHAILVACVVLFSTSMASSTAFGIDVQLKGMRPSDEARSGFPFDYVTLEKSTTAPAGAWKLPAFQCETPVYAFLELGGEKRLLVLDVDNRSATFYNRIYFDANGNKDLTDDPAVGQENPGEPFAYSPSFVMKDIPVKANGLTVPYSFRIYLSYRGRKSKIPSASSIKRSLQVFAAADTWYTGAFDHKGVQYRICLGDGNANGRFDDAPVIPDLTRLGAGSQIVVKGDMVLLSSGKEMDYTRFQVFGEYLVLNGETFKRSVDPGKGLLTLAPVTEGLSTLKLGMETESLCIFTEKDPVCVSMFNPGKECMVPPGTYRLACYRALRKDGQGDLWGISANAPMETPTLSLAEGKEGILRFGEPFIAYAEVPAWCIKSVQGGRDQASIEFHIRGAAKEQVTDLIRLSGDKTRIPLSKVEKNRPEEAAFKVMSDGGELVAEGHFEYG